MLEAENGIAEILRKTSAYRDNFAFKFEVAYGSPGAAVGSCLHAGLQSVVRPGASMHMHRGLQYICSHPAS